MAYDYVKKAYGFTAEIGRRVRHTVTHGEGVIAREDKGNLQYVQVKFDGKKFSLPCHPDEIVYI
jgi:hypothetical protein